MAERPDFQEKQFAFAAHIRDPVAAPAPDGIEDRRMAIYRELFFNNLRNLLGGMFPVLRKLCTEAQWRDLIRAFMRQHRARTPYFLELPAEFVDFLQHEYTTSENDFPFLSELAHYEYIEIALSISEAANPVDGVDPDGDLLAGAPVKSELAWIHAYRYPVHRISPDFVPGAPSDQPIYLAVCRGSDDKVRFLELNPLSAGLLDAIARNDAASSGESLLRTLAQKTGYEDVDAFLGHGLAALRDMRAREILIGTRPAQT